MAEEKKGDEKKEEKPVDYHNAKEILEKIFGKDDKRTKSLWSHKIVYDSPAEQLEPVYFWILDFLTDSGNDVKKIVDNFTSSPGGGYFAEVGARASRMQEEGMKLLGAVNQVIKSIINIIYDLKEFEVRLKQYEAAKDKNKAKAEAGLLGLKQIWMDKVDINRGRGSINMMSYELGFTTLRDAFMAANSIEELKKGPKEGGIDINERVRRILLARVQEFLDWKVSSEAELKKRYEIERNYLRSQYNTLKLYTQWALPYLRAAGQLTSRALQTAAIVNVFNTMVLELTLLAKKTLKPEGLADDNLVPKSFKEKEQRKEFKRKYLSCMLIDFKFRGIPYRDQRGGYVYGGKAEITFQSFALNEEELRLFEKEIEKSSMEETLKLVNAVTEDSLKQILEDIEHFLGKEEEKKPEKKPGFFEFIFGEKKKEEKKKQEIKSPKEIKPDNFDEKLLRAIAETQAAQSAFTIYDVYKKSHGMSSFTEPEWEASRTKHLIGKRLAKG